ncbi:MAG TPA: glycosyltransferase [Pyrinomonadaceae bacterium]
MSLMLNNGKEANAVVALQVPDSSPRLLEPRDEQNDVLSVIIRFHLEERLVFLEEAIFSLAIQDWHSLEVIVVLQNGTDELKRTVSEIIQKQPWPGQPLYQILLVPISAGVDGRSTLMNRGISQARGRYLAFLDDDDFVYQHGYATLIGQLVAGGRSVAIGGCRRANIQREGNHWFVQSKENFFAWGRSRLDLFHENFVPIHSYVLDRFRLGEFELYFDDACPPLEDYDFLLRLFEAVEPDFSQLDVPVCEYRIRLDGSNSLAYSENAPPEVILRQKRAQELVKERKRQIIRNMPAEQQRALKEKVCADLFTEPDPELPTSERPAAIFVPTVAGENPMVREVRARCEEDRRVLLQITRHIYLFFSRHPWLELTLSRMLHWTWRRFHSRLA